MSDRAEAEIFPTSNRLFIPLRKQSLCMRIKQHWHFTCLAPTRDFEVIFRAFAFFLSVVLMKAADPVLERCCESSLL